MLRIIRFLIALVLLSACSTNPSPIKDSSGATLIPDTAPLASSVPFPTSAPTHLPFAGEAYLLLRTVSAPYTYQFAHVPIVCLTAQLNCGSWQSVSGIPSQNYSPTSNEPLHWSPNGSVALFINTNTGQLISFDPINQKIKVIANDFYSIQDKVVWSSNGQFVLVALQGNSAYSSYVALVDLVNSIVQPVGVNWQSLDGLLDIVNMTRMQYPLAWLDTDEILVYAARYEPDEQSSPISSKKNVVEGGLYRVNITTGALTTLYQNPDWVVPPVMSPVGNLFALLESGVNNLTVRATNAPETALFQLKGDALVWSSDSNWIATSETNAAGYTIWITSSDGTQTLRFQSSIVVYSLYWLPDNEHLLVVGVQPGSTNGVEKTALMLISIPSGTMESVSIPALDLDKQFIVGVSWQVIATPSLP